MRIWLCEQTTCHIYNHQHPVIFSIKFTNYHGKIWMPFSSTTTREYWLHAPSWRCEMGISCFLFQKCGRKECKIEWTIYLKTKRPRKMVAALHSVQAQTRDYNFKKETWHEINYAKIRKRMAARQQPSIQFLLSSSFLFPW